MLVVETIARIRREHFVKGKTIKPVCKGGVKLRCPRSDRWPQLRAQGRSTIVAHLHHDRRISVRRERLTRPLCDAFAGRRSEPAWWKP